MNAWPRPYSGAQDSERLRSWLADVRRRHGDSCWHVGDLTWRLFLHSIRYDLGQTLRLWEDRDGSLLGFAVVTPPAETDTIYFDLQVDPKSRGQGLEEQMLDWVESGRSGATLGTAGSRPPRLVTDTGVYDDDEGQIEALERRGFVRKANKGLLLHRSLDDPIAAPSLAAGFVVRPVAGPHEIPERAAAHRSAFSPSRITDAAYLCLARTPGYLSALDLVAARPDGCFGAFCIAWLDTVNGVGEFEPVGTRPVFRRLGLARAMLSDGLRRLSAVGMARAIVGPIPADYRPALGLYQSVGFRPIHELYTLIRGC